jgi:hypothetical protein
MTGGSIRRSQEKKTQRRRSRNRRRRRAPIWTSGDVIGYAGELVMAAA